MTIITEPVFVNGQRIDVNTRDPAIAASPRCVWTGGCFAGAVTPYTDFTLAASVGGICEFYVPERMLFTGAAILNGSVVAGNITLWVCRADGAVIADTVSAATAQSGTDALQRIDFGVPTNFNRGTHYLLIGSSSNTSRLRAHAAGTFYAAQFNFSAPANIPSISGTFTAGKGPVATFY